MSDILKKLEQYEGLVDVPEPEEEEPEYINADVDGPWKQSIWSKTMVDKMRDDIMDSIAELDSQAETMRISLHK